MSYAQQIRLASARLLRRMQEEGIEVPPDVRVEWYRRVERWCVEAQVAQPA